MPAPYSELMTDAAPSITGTLPIFESKLHHQPIWHYTDSAGLVGILTGVTTSPKPWREEDPAAEPRLFTEQTGTLRATAATLLNDFSELRYGAERIRRWYETSTNATGGTARDHIAIRFVLNDLVSQLAENPAYVCCASTVRDSLEHWRGYAGDGGYAIQLDPAQTYTLLQRPSVETEFMVAPVWLRVRYSPAEQDELIETIFEQLLRPHSLVGRMLATDDTASAITVVRANLAALAAVLKHPAFAKEEEVRLIVQRPPAVQPEFRPSRRGPVPYLTLGHAPLGNAQSPTVFTPLPIGEVLVGPPTGEAMEQRERGSRMLLDATGRSGTPVNLSNIPFLP